MPDLKAGKACDLATLFALLDLCSVLVMSHQLLALLVGAMHSNLPHAFFFSDLDPEELIIVQKLDRLQELCGLPITNCESCLCTRQPPRQASMAVSVSTFQSHHLCRIEVISTCIACGRRCLIYHVLHLFIIVNRLNASIVTTNHQHAGILLSCFYLMVEDDTIRIETLAPNDDSGQALVEDCVNIVNPPLNRMPVLPLDVCEII